MRNLALSIAAVLVLAVVSPAVAQPFADVPTDHWAFDAIAELAAKGVIEGYPDGTFKGDRGITRYEVAMIVARILARIEAIKVPAPAAPAAPPAAAPPAVTPAQVQTIQRLVNEFRAELAALGVRVTAVEEELAALKGAKDATAVTGDWTYVNTFNTGTTGAVERNRGRLTYKGTAGGGTSLLIRARFNALTNSTTTCQGTPTQTNCADFDKVYLDTSAFGLKFRVGRDYWSLGEGLLLNTAPPTGGSGSQNGVRASGSFAGFDWTLLGYNSTVAALASTYAARVGFDLAGWSLGVNYRQTNNFTAGTTTSGYSADFSGNLFGFDLSGEYASYGSPAVTAYTVNLALNLGLPVNVWYKDYPAGYPDDDTANNSFGGFWKGSELINVTGVGADVAFQITDSWSVKFGYESGTDNVAAASYNRQLFGTEYSLGTNALFGLEYFTGSGGAATDFGYAAYLTYNW